MVSLVSVRSVCTVVCMWAEKKGTIYGEQDTMLYWVGCLKNERNETKETQGLLWCAAKQACSKLWTNTKTGRQTGCQTGRKTTLVPTTGRTTGRKTDRKTGCQHINSQTKTHRQNSQLSKNSQSHKINCISVNVDPFDLVSSQGGRFIVSLSAGHGHKWITWQLPGKKAI